MITSRPQNILQTVNMEETNYVYARHMLQAEATVYTLMKQQGACYQSGLR